MSNERQYRAGLHRPAGHDQGALAELHPQVQAVVERLGATIEQTENWGRRKLAYEINGHAKASTSSKDQRPAAMTDGTRSPPAGARQRHAAPVRSAWTKSWQQPSARRRPARRDGAAPRAPRAAGRADRERAPRREDDDDDGGRRSGGGFRAGGDR